MALAEWLIKTDWMLAVLPRGQHITLTWPEMCYVAAFDWLIRDDVAADLTATWMTCGVDVA